MRQAHSQVLLIIPSSRNILNLHDQSSINITNSTNPYSYLIKKCHSLSFKTKLLSQPCYNLHQWCKWLIVVFYHQLITHDNSLTEITMIMAWLILKTLRCNLHRTIFIQIHRIQRVMVICISINKFVQYHWAIWLTVAISSYRQVNLSI